jgi:hypothetical protein
MRLAAFGFAALALSTGCVSTEAQTDGRTLQGVPIATPDPAKVNPASLKTAERVQTLGQRIIDQNTFTGLVPLFHTLGIPDPVLFHRGPDELFISESLVSRCKTEEQLAAVLCSELGAMMAEKRSAKNVGVDLVSVREDAQPHPLGEGEVASAEAAPTVKPKETTPSRNANELARDLLRGSGFEEAELAKHADLLKDVNRNLSLGRQIAGPAPAPQWQR